MCILRFESIVKSDSSLTLSSTAGLYPMALSARESTREKPMRKRLRKVRYLFDMYTSTELVVDGLIQLLRRKGVFGRNGELFRSKTICRMLSNRRYVGEYHWVEVLSNCLPALVDKEFFDNFRKTEPRNCIPLPSSTTKVGWSAIARNIRTSFS